LILFVVFFRIPEPKYHEDKDYLQALRRQVAGKQKNLEVNMNNTIFCIKI
jgi:hypothetical protein